MVDVSVLPAFLVAVLVILAAPGPDMAFMIAAGVSGGRSAAIRAALGVTAGVSVYVLATAAGLGLLLARAPAALDAIRVIGAAYLTYLAWQTFTHAGAEHHGGATGDHVFCRGFIVNLTNPKIALFFIAFLPQFLGAASAEPAAQLLMLGLVLQTCGLAVDLAIGLAAGAVRDRVLRNRTARLALDLLSGAVYLTLATLLIIDTLTG